MILDTFQGSYQTSKKKEQLSWKDYHMRPGLRFFVVYQFFSPFTLTKGGASRKMTWWQGGGGGGLDTPIKWWRHLWTAPYGECIYLCLSVFMIVVVGGCICLCCFLCTFHDREAVLQWQVASFMFFRGRSLWMLFFLDQLFVQILCCLYLCLCLCLCLWGSLCAISPKSWPYYSGGGCSAEPVFYFIKDVMSVFVVLSL